MAELPKLSYVLLSHNREQYIRRAIETAFAQDYEGELEYIFSDDCSTDRTFDIIQECVAAYTGNRRVVVTRTPRNLHLAGNTNHALSFVQSDWIVRADDDDLATPDRCSVVGRAIAEFPDATYVFTRMAEFTDADEPEVLTRISHREEPIPEAQVHDIRDGFDALGAFAAPLCLHQVWSVGHYRQFGPLPADASNVDDVVSLYRSAVLGRGICINAVTMFVRNGSGNMSKGGDDGARGYDSIMRLEKFNDRYYNQTYRPLEETVQAVTRYVQEQVRPEEQERMQSFLKRLQTEQQTRAMLRTYWRNGTLNRFRIARKLRYRGLFPLLRCLPMPLFAFLLALYRKFR